MNIIKVVKETSSAFFVFKVFINWGKNAAVVKIAAKYPKMSTFIKVFKTTLKLSQIKIPWDPSCLMNIQAHHSKRIYR